MSVLLGINPSVVGFFEGIKFIDNKIKLYGWAKHPKRNVPADKILIFDQSDNIIARATTGVERIDVENSYKDGGLRYSGWEALIENDNKFQSANVLYAYVIDGDKRYKLSGKIEPNNIKGTMFSGYNLDTLIKRGLKVGKNFNLQAECFIDFPHCWLIAIGDDVTFAPRVHLIAHDSSTRNFLGHTKVGLIEIGNRVFIGNNAIVLPGVTIGDDVIIGAGSVVTKDVPSGCVYAGNPARFIIKTSDYLSKSKELLEYVPVFGSDYTIEKGISDDKKQDMIRRLKKSGGVGFI